MINKNIIKKELKGYFDEIKRNYDTHNYTEYTFRTPLQNLIEKLDQNYKLTQEPQRTEGLGAPDFKAFNKNIKVGYIETKNLNDKLDLKTNQLKKYIGIIDNLILTNYLEFILIRKGSRVYYCNIFTFSDLAKRTMNINDEEINKFIHIIDGFFGYNQPTISSAEELSKELSKRAKLLKEMAYKQLQDDLNKVKNNETPSAIYNFYKWIREWVGDRNIEDCADDYAQTFTYGLFLAKLECGKNKLNKNNVLSYITKKVKIIYELFFIISHSNFPSNILWIVEEIIDILNAAEDLQIILNPKNQQTITSQKTNKDPIIYFYEDFLNNYEREKRERLGVYYTPIHIVKFIVKSVHEILKIDFSKQLGLAGLAEGDIKLLDPAVGTGTFLYEIFNLVISEFYSKYPSYVNDIIKNHVLKNFYGFEILITPYVISHLKLIYLLEKEIKKTMNIQYNLQQNERIQVYLTNTLEEPKVNSISTFIASLEGIEEENRMADTIKGKNILAIIGNPPYSGISANKNDWIDGLLKTGYDSRDGKRISSYYEVDGKPLGEKKLWLQDDYVKFIRFAQWKIDKNGKGIVGYITNHSYLDNPTFRGMRESLLKSFDRIYILNLHGNSQKKEKCPDGSKDENVFDIRQGVAISIFIKNKKSVEKKVYYADLWGTRDYKYTYLENNNIDNIDWQELKPISPYYFFIPKNTNLQDEYEKFWKITDIFIVNSVGIVTARDHFTIKWNPEEIWETVIKFVQMDIEEARKEFELKKDVESWSVKQAQNDLKVSKLDKSKIIPILYRPFDIRYTYYTGKSNGFHARPIFDIMQHMLKENLGLVTVRQVAEGIFNHIYVSNTIIESRITLSNKGIGYLFPLYLYSDADKTPNFSPEFLAFISEKYGDIIPEEIFYYIYAVLHSPNYREKYKEFLQYDFPRIPFVDDYEKFKKLLELGKELVELHLMKKNLSTKVKFNIPGSNIVENGRYENGKVWINKEQYFDGVPEDVWNFYIGGYQVLDKWLKSRKGRELKFDEVEHFLQVVEVIRETIRLMSEIKKCI